MGSPAASTGAALPIEVQQLPSPLRASAAKTMPNQDPTGTGSSAKAPPDVRLWLLIWRTALTVGTVAGIVVEHGFSTPPIRPGFIHLIQLALLGTYSADLWLAHRRDRHGLRHGGPVWAEATILVVAAVSALAEIPVVAVPNVWRLLELSAVLLFINELWRLNVGLSRLSNRPGILLPLSFFTLIAVGTPLLKVPMAVPNGQTISWLDALFTMTSAVCVTGLVVRDTATQLTPFGQAAVGVFIQLGGLGIVIFGSTLAVVLGARLSLRDHVSLRTALTDVPLQRVTSFVRFIVLVTLFLELVGAVALMPMWAGSLTLTQRLSLSLFHSVSAFCNAGFSLQSNSLESYRYAPQVHLVIGPLLVIGGLGFPVLDNLWRAGRWRWQRWSSRAQRSFLAGPSDAAEGRLNLHTKIVLFTTATLYVYGVVAVTAGQVKPHTDAFFQQGITARRSPPQPLDIRGLGAVLADSSFTSLTSRTAGFNTVPMEELSPVGRFTIMTLMMIGASPGGTAGGMKTTTLALLLLLVAATVRRRQHTEAFSRRISDQLIHKAATLAACFVALATVATGLLCLSEPYPFEKIAFEAISAASTTGLSLGITGDLTAFGKTVIIATMFLGRIGPLALLGALLFRPGSVRPYTYPHEDVAMG